MSFFSRLRDLGYIVKAWFTRSPVLYEHNIKRGPYGSGQLVVTKRLMPKFKVSVSELTTKSAKFMTDFRLLCAIPKKYWANPNVSAFEIANYSNADVASTDELGDDEMVEVGDFDSDQASSDVAGAMNVYASNAKRMKRAEAPKKLETALYEPKLSPAEVFHELGIVPAKADMTNLDEKISTMERSLGLIRVERNRGNSSTTKDILERLNNRKTYRDTTDENKAFFDQYKCTDDEHIVALLEKHQHLKIGPVDDFIPEMPAAAQQAMLGYMDKCVELFKTKPVLYIIAKQEEFVRAVGARQKRDPILLVQSPFGLYWQILGAWGSEEMLALDEL